MERVGVIGVGRMGLAMVKHLLKRGFPVTACDIDAANLSKAHDLGASVAGTPAELCRQFASDDLEQAFLRCIEAAPQPA